MTNELKNLENLSNSETALKNSSLVTLTKLAGNSKHAKQRQQAKKGLCFHCSFTVSAEIEVALGMF